MLDGKEVALLLQANAVLAATFGVFLGEEASDLAAAAVPCGVSWGCACRGLRTFVGPGAGIWKSQRRESSRSPKIPNSINHDTTITPARHGPLPSSAQPPSGPQDEQVFSKQGMQKG